MTVVGAHLVGEQPVIPIYDGVMRIDAREFLIKPGFDGDPWEPHTHLLNERGELEFVMSAYLIPMGDRTVLVDAGIGTITTDDFSGGALLESLAAEGVQPDDVTDVILTHLHFDHVGWTTQQGKIVFPNATYRCHADDWAHFVEADDANDRAVSKLTPLHSQLETFDTDHTVAPGIDVRHTPGHTPGSTVIVVSNGSARAMLLGDVVHCPAELTEDDWATTFDVDPALATRNREALARELEGTDTMIGAAHFPGLRFGRLLAGEGQRQWVYEN